MITNEVKRNQWAPVSGDEVTMRAKNDACITARYGKGGDGPFFKIINAGGYVHDLSAAREAAEFFTLLADILESK